MIALQIQDIGILIREMLKGDMFDRFLLQEAVITREVTHSIDGSINADYFDAAEAEQLPYSTYDFIPFHKVKPYCLDLLKGQKKPAAFKFVFLLSPENQSKTIERSGTAFRPEDVRGMYINLIYKSEQLICTTGISYQTFTMDKSLEKEWDRMTQLFLKQHGIAAETA